MQIFNPRAYDVFKPTDGSGNARGASMSEAQAWGIGIEQAILARTSIDTLAELTSLEKANLVDGEKVMVLDGETGGIFTWDEDSTATADGTDTLAPDEGGDGRWLRDSNNLASNTVRPGYLAAEVAVRLVEFDIRDSQFAGGAPMNGIDDDGPALRAAVAYAQSLGSRYEGAGGAVHIPRGIVRLDSTDPTKTDRCVDLTGATNVTLYSESEASATIKGSLDKAMFKGDDTTASPLYRFMMRDLTIEGPGYTNVNADGIDLGANNNCLFQNVRVWACRTGILWDNAFHTEFVNLRMNGQGGLACYNGLWARDGDLAVQESSVGIYGGRIQGCKNWGYRGECITGSYVQGLEVLGCEGTSVYLGDSPGGKDLKWFNWEGGLNDTAPDLLVVRKGTSTVAEEVHFNFAWHGYASEGLPGAGVGVDIVGLRNSSFQSRNITNTQYAANIESCERFTFRVNTISMYDRLLTGGAAIICNNTIKSRFDIGTTERDPSSTSTVSFVEQGTSDYNQVTGVFDRAVTLIGANSVFTGIQNTA